MEEIFFKQTEFGKDYYRDKSAKREIMTLNGCLDYVLKIRKAQKAGDEDVRNFAEILAAYEVIRREYC